MSIEEYIDKAANVITEDFKIEVEKLIRVFMKKYHVLDAIVIPMFFVYVKPQDN